MDYEKKYKEALERAKKFYNELAACRTKQKVQDLDIVPELRPTAWGEGYQHGCKDTEEKYSGMVVVSQEEWDTAIADAFKHGMDEGERQKEQKPAEWSEEDETCLEDALWCVMKTRHFVAKDACDLDACRCAERWLKSLRPQSQGIYQQVVKRLRDMCDRYEKNGMFTDERARDFLGNVRVKCKEAIECAPILDEPNWKPSEEQSEVDLEEETKRYWKEEMPVVLESDLNDIARHFYELGKTAREEESK